MTFVYEPEFVTACGRKIRISKKAQKHLHIHGDMQAILPEAINKITLPENGHLDIEVDMGRIVGKQASVELPPSGMHDSMTFAYRHGRKRPSRVIDGHNIENETSFVTIIAKPDERHDGQYTLITAWIGRKSQKEPCDTTISSNDEMNRCIEFWCAHALMYDPKTMSPIFSSSWSDVLDGIHESKFAKKRKMPHKTP